MPRAAALIALIVAVAVAAPVARQAQPFAVEEATIAAVHAAMRAGRLTCRALVDTTCVASTHSTRTARR